MKYKGVEDIVVILVNSVLKQSLLTEPPALPIYKFPVELWRYESNFTTERNGNNFQVISAGIALKLEKKKRQIVFKFQSMSNFFSLPSVATYAVTGNYMFRCLNIQPDFFKKLPPNGLYFPSNSFFFRPKTIPKVAIIKSMSTTIAFFFFPLFFLLFFSFEILFLSLV